MKILILIAVFVFNSPAVFANSNENVLIQPFRTDQSFQLYDSPDKSLKSKTNRLFERWDLNARIAISPSAPNSMFLAKTGIEILDLRFSIDGFPLCQYQLKAHQTAQGKYSAFGRLPTVDPEKSYTIADWPHETDITPLVQATMREQNLPQEFTRESSQPCLWVADGAIHAVWRWEVVADQLRYSLIAGQDKVFEFQKMHFDVNGKAAVYPNNILDSATVEFQLRDMASNGYLDNKYFKTVLDDPLQRAQSQSLNFAFDPILASSQFIETSLFTNANRALEWLESVGYRNFGSTQIKLFAHASFSGDINNALYQPGMVSSSIYVGDGDGTVLQNLGTDADVVSHELNHHVIYHSLTSIAGEALVLHEGLADFLTFARTKNACLGESVCPNTSYGNAICWMPRKCLRSAENTLKFGASGSPSQAHQKGQIISGMLWDLHAKDGMALNDISRLVLQTIELLVADSGYEHFMVGLLMADESLFKGQYCPLILNRAIDRGFGLYVEKVECQAGSEEDAALPDLDQEEFADTLEPSLEEPSQKAETDESTSRNGKAICGVTTGMASNHGHSWLVCLLWLVPLGFRHWIGGRKNG